MPCMMQEYYLNGIYYRKNTFRRRPTLVFIHGLTGSSSAWIPYEKKFEKYYNLLSVDLRGHGKSAKSPNSKDYYIPEMARDVFKVVHHERIPRFTLVSHSFGNFVAYEFLKHHSSKTNSAIFVSPVYKPSERAISTILHPLFVLNRLLEPLNLFTKKGSHLDYRKYYGTGDCNLRRMYAD